MATFYDIFTDLCIQNHVSPRKACIDMGLSHSAAAKWKCTGGAPNSTTLRRIAKYFGVNILDLLDNEERVNTFPDAGEVVNMNEEEEWVVRMWKAATPEERAVVRFALNTVEKRLLAEQSDEV